MQRVSGERVSKRGPIGPLDPILHPDRKQYNSRLLIDACRPFEWRDKFPQAIGPDAKTKAETRKKWGYLLDRAPELAALADR